MGVKWMFAILIVMAGCRPPSPQDDLKLSAAPELEASFVTIAAPEGDMQLLGCACQKMSSNKFRLFSYYVRQTDGFKVALAAAMPLTGCIEARREQNICPAEELEG